MNTFWTITIAPASFIAWMRGDYHIECDQCHKSLLPPRRIRTGLIAAQCPHCLRYVVVNVVESEVMA